MKSILLALILLPIGACSKEAAPAESAASASQAGSVCVEIATTCHEHEGVSAKAKECHEKGHSKQTTEQECQAMRTACLDECNTAAEQGHQGSEHDHHSEGSAAPAHPAHPATTESEHAH